MPVINTYIKVCIDISIWMNTSCWKLMRIRPNSLFILRKKLVKKIENLRIKVGSSCINSSMSVRNLWLILYNTLGMEKQLNYICKSCYYQIRNIGLICKFINDETCKTLVQALIISWQDNGNTLLYKIRQMVKWTT